METLFLVDDQKNDNETASPPPRVVRSAHCEGCGLNQQKVFIAVNSLEIQR